MAYNYWHPTGFGHALKPAPPPSLFPLRFRINSKSEWQEPARLNSLNTIPKEHFTSPGMLFPGSTRAPDPRVPHVTTSGKERARNELNAFPDPKPRCSESENSRQS